MLAIVVEPVFDVFKNKTRVIGVHCTVSLLEVVGEVEWLLDECLLYCFRCCLSLSAVYWTDH